MSKAALDDIRVISMGSVWAGPYAARVLAELGAEVIRIEFFGQGPRRGNPELMAAWGKSLVARGMSPADAEKVTTFIPLYAAPFGGNTYNVGLDLRQDQGKEVYKNLAGVTDIVIDGWSPRVMANLGLDYTVLKELNPGIIYASIPALGMSGPDRDVRMYGSGCEALSGMDSVRGYADGWPYPSSAHVPDPIAAMHILAAILAALNHRTETGRGQQIDISQTECATMLISDAIMDYTMNGRIARPQGNRHPYFAPHGCYRCRGKDKWVTIAVTSEDEWHNLCIATDHSDWLTEPRFSDMLSRWQNQEELDTLIEEWTGQHYHYAAQEILQNASVRAAAVATIDERVNYDTQVRDRDLYQWLTYTDGVADPVARVPWVLPKTPTRLDKGAAYTGQHNAHILGKILGMSAEEITRLEQENVIGQVPPKTA